MDFLGFFPRLSLTEPSDPGPFQPPSQAVKEKTPGVFTASCQDGDAAPIFDLDAHDEVGTLRSL